MRLQDMLEYGKGLASKMRTAYDDYGKDYETRRFFIATEEFFSETQETYQVIHKENPSTLAVVFPSIYRRLTKSYKNNKVLSALASTYLAAYPIMSTKLEPKVRKRAEKIKSQL